MILVESTLFIIASGAGNPEGRRLCPIEFCVSVRRNDSPSRRWHTGMSTWGDRISGSIAIASGICTWEAGKFMLHSPCENPHPQWQSMAINGIWVSWRTIWWGARTSGIIEALCPENKRTPDIPGWTQPYCQILSEHCQNIPKINWFITSTIWSFRKIGIPLVIIHF